MSLWGTVHAYPVGRINNMSRRHTHMQTQFHTAVSLPQIFSKRHNLFILFSLFMVVSLTSCNISEIFDFKDPKAEITVETSTTGETTVEIVDIAISNQNPITGDPFTVSLEVKNSGVVDGGDIQVKIRLDNATAKNLEGSNCVKTDDGLTCTVSTIEAGESKHFTIELEANSDGKVSIDAQIVGSEESANSLHIEFESKPEATTPVVVTDYDLGISDIHFNKNNIYVDNLFIATIKLKNSGEATVEGASVRLSLANSMAGDLSGSACVASSPQIISCPVTSLGMNGEVSTSVNLVAGSTTGMMTVAAELLDIPNDTNAANNSLSQQIETLSVTSYDLAIVDLTANTSTVFTGSAFSVSVDLNNLGTGTVEGAKLSLTLLNASAADSLSTNCAVNGDGLILCDIGTLAADASLNIPVNLVAGTTVGAIGISAQLESLPLDTVADNNSAQLQIQSKAQLTGEYCLAVDPEPPADPLDQYFQAGKALCSDFVVGREQPYSIVVNGPLAGGINLRVYDSTNKTICANNAPSSENAYLACSFIATTPTINIAVYKHYQDPTDYGHLAENSAYLKQETGYKNVSDVVLNNAGVVYSQVQVTDAKSKGSSYFVYGNDATYGGNSTTEFDSNYARVVVFLDNPDQLVGLQVTVDGNAQYSQTPVTYKGVPAIICCDGLTRFRSIRVDVLGRGVIEYPEAPLAETIRNGGTSYTIELEKIAP